MISLVIPLYNKDKSILRAIKSAANQTLPFDEIIVVNDGSTDNSYEVVKSCGFKNIRLINQKNHGVSSARNNGIEACTSKYVCLLDADDELAPEYNAEMHYMINKYPDSHIYSTSHKVVSREDIIFDYGRHGIEVYNNPILTYAGNYGLINSSTVCLNINKIGQLRFPVGKKMGEDIYFWLKIFDKSVLVHNKRSLCTIYRNAENRSDGDIAVIPYQFEFFLDKKIKMKPSLRYFIFKNAIIQMYSAYLYGKKIFFHINMHFFWKNDKTLFFLCITAYLIPRWVLRWVRDFRKS